MFTETLFHGAGGRRLAGLRLPNGADELAGDGVAYADAAAFIGRLLVPGPGRIEASDIPALPISDLDQLVQATFAMLVGSVCEIHCRCAGCAKPFEFALPLASLKRSPEAGDAQPCGEQRFRLPGGTVLRLPTVGDILGVDGASAPGSSRFVCETGEDGSDAIEAALARLCPVTADLVETECPACGAATLVDFDLAIFLMKSLRRERDLLLREVHLIARAYGWSLSEILSLPRDVRHGFVRLAGGKPAALRRSAA